MKEVGEIIEIDGKKYEVTFVAGENFSYKPYEEHKEVEVKHRRRTKNV